MSSSQPMMPAMRPGRFTARRAVADFLTLSLSPSLAEDAKPVDTSIAVMQFDKTTWVKTVAAANFFEIESSKIALEKSSSEDVKKFAQQMIDDHTKAGEKLASVLKNQGMELPPRDLAPKQADAIELLKKVDGKDFDAAYVSLQHGAHMEAVTLFMTYAAKPDDAALGAFAKETVPTLEMHLEHVKMLAAM
jgi:putative membrane protein